MNKLTKFSAIAFGIGGLILFSGEREWFPDFYNLQFMGIIGLLSGLWRLFLRVSFSNLMKLNFVRFVRLLRKIKALNLLQNTLAVILLLNAAGALGFFQLYKIGFDYDKFLHFVISPVSVVVLVYFSRYWYGAAPAKLLILSITLIFLAGVAWEVFEFFGDQTLGTRMFGHYGKFATKDTIWDLTLNVIGIAAGAIVSVVKIKQRGVEV